MEQALCEAGEHIRSSQYQHGGGRFFMESDHIPWFGTPLDAADACRPFSWLDPTGDVWGLASVFMKLAGIVKTQSESRHFAFHLSLQIGFLALSRSLDLFLLRAAFLEPPCLGLWFGWNTRDGGTLVPGPKVFPCLLHPHKSLCQSLTGGCAVHFREAKEPVLLRLLHYTFSHILKKINTPTLILVQTSQQQHMVSHC